MLCNATPTTKRVVISGALGTLQRWVRSAVSTLATVGAHWIDRIILPLSPDWLTD